MLKSSLLFIYLSVSFVACDSTSTNTPTYKYKYAELYRDHLYTKLSDMGKELFYAINIRVYALINDVRYFRHIII